MRLVYVDEAGISDKKQEPFLVVAGVIIDTDKQLVALERHLDKIVARHIPPQHRENFVFHASHLFNGGGKVFTRNNPEWPLATCDCRRIGRDTRKVPASFASMITVNLLGKFKSNARLSCATYQRVN